MMDFAKALGELLDITRGEFLERAFIPRQLSLGTGIYSLRYLYKQLARNLAGVS